MKTAIVEGAYGRVGSAFASRLRRDGWTVHALARDNVEDWTRVRLEESPYIFDCSYQHGDPWGHVEHVVQLLRDHRHFSGIFIPSSEWIGTDGGYGQAKLVIEQLAVLYRAGGANVVTDRIGYFPGDGVEPDPRDPFYHRLITGDALYARVMEKLL